MKDGNLTATEGKSSVPAVPSVELLAFADALRIARGCHDYNGGHHSDGHYEAYHHGIQTVINVLEAAEKSGLKDTQVLMVWRLGKIAGVCTTCGGNVLHREGKPGEFDHECTREA
jgi:hypothetical protein